MDIQTEDLVKRLQGSLLATLLLMTTLAFTGPAASAGTWVAPPTLIEANYNGRYVGVKWRYNRDHAKVEIYRDRRNGSGLQYVTTINSGNVYNDYSGKPEYIYQTLAHDRDGNLSSRSQFFAATGDNKYDIESSSPVQPRRRNPFTNPPTLNELEQSFNSPARQQNAEMLERYKDILEQQKADFEYIHDLKEAEAWDREQEERRNQRSDNDNNNRHPDGTRPDGSGGATRPGDLGDGTRGQRSDNDSNGTNSGYDPASPGGDYDGTPF